MQSNVSETFSKGGKHLSKKTTPSIVISVIEILSIFTFWLNSPTGRPSPLDFNSSLCPCTSKLSNCDQGEEEEEGNNNNKKVFRRLNVRSPGCLLYLCLPLASYSRHAWGPVPCQIRSTRGGDLSNEGKRGLALALLFALIAGSAPLKRKEGCMRDDKMRSKMHEFSSFFWIFYFAGSECKKTSMSLKKKSKHHPFQTKQTAVQLLMALCYAKSIEIKSSRPSKSWKE